VNAAFVWDPVVASHVYSEEHPLKPKRLIGDTAYGSAEMLAWIVGEKNIEPHVPVWDKGERDDGTFSRSDFTYDAEANAYTCPSGKTLGQFNRNYATPRSGADRD